ncbi:long-chain acyl-CoA synthetase [Paenibacillus naphthalenovorans]|uniref:long-chain-fatty-acid--CoA ligase n=1 Tax=Paenibacillus naphthalenovorans TaxID=162209 RepID=UPI0010B0B60C|nr:long-chain-fatty-acid--CoA ligase [Paenibacillus naphthalenovorans]GCL71561.1 long-chain acyl-CoA synthetase [Paenibacillus naphthalenovorans]
MYQDCYGLTVTELFERAYKLNPSKEVIYDRSRRLTYQELREESIQLAASLQDLQVEKGDRVAVCLPNWHEFVVIYLALSHLGAILIPFNTRYRQEEVEYILSNSGAKLVFCTDEFGGVPHYEQFSTLLKSSKTLQQMISVRFERPGMLSYHQLLERGKHLPLTFAAIDRREDVFGILYTSGTTGRPKGVMLTHANVVHTAAITAESMRCTPDDVMLVAVPVFHVFGITPSILTNFACGGKMVLVDVFKPKDVLELIQNEGITIHHGVPTMFILELNHPAFSVYDLSSLRTGIIAAAPCPVEVVKRIRSDMGCDIVVAYGLTETSPTLTITDFNDDDRIRSETVGKVLPGAEVKIVNGQREPVAFGEVGELACRGFGVMKGYYQMPQETKAVIDDEGWLYTGDLATIDKDGYIRIVGRSKEMIIRGGYNIYPREIEEVLYKHPEVLEAAVVGLPDSVLGEITCSAVRLKSGAKVEAEELKQFIRERMADYKTPDKIVFMHEFPMTPSGKIKKMDLQQQLKIELEGQLR